ncbi:transcriptional regulator [Exiguobacterium sp. SH4S7]|uniref:helix-turn-helix transcriptional regulator n=1 Tax=Exiguobacterium sp. SH4S7 TaxID=2510958 RepID=UPI00103B8D10|nr:helix-turn-helix transcriptional regulator [Exiguobacterium sp. SH4S7]TCI33826.1 transcriptional regulator [Exiguobacterium sp. SH4S7]
MNNRLRNFRESNNLSQGDLAKRLNVSRQTIISIEKGRYNPSLDLAFSIAAIFNCRIEDIFIPNLELVKGE